MKAIEFPEQNLVIAKDQPQYLPLPVYQTDNAQGEIIMKVEVTPEDLEQITKNGHFWVSVWTFGQLVQPIRHFAEYPFKELVMLESITPELLKELLKENTLVGNLEIGRDKHLFKVVTTLQDDVTLNTLNPVTGEVINTIIKTYTEISDTMKVSLHAEKWFIVNS